MGASIYTSTMVLPYKAAATLSYPTIPTLDRLESESNMIGQNNPHFDTREYPKDIALDEWDDIVYVGNRDSGMVSVIDVDTMEILDVIVGQGPESIVISEWEDIVYVANKISNTVSVINGTGGNYTNIANIPVGYSPRSIAVDLDDNIAYVANSGGTTVSVITRHQLLAQFDINILELRSGKL